MEGDSGITEVSVDGGDNRETDQCDAQIQLTKTETLTGDAAEISTDEPNEDKSDADVTSIHEDPSNAETEKLKEAVEESSEVVKQVEAPESPTNTTVENPILDSQAQGEGDVTQSAVSAENGENLEHEAPIDSVTATETESVDNTLPANDTAPDISEDKQDEAKLKVSPTNEASPVSGGGVGPSDDREDISDEELVLDTSGNAETKQPSSLDAGAVTESATSANPSQQCPQIPGENPDQVQEVPDSETSMVNEASAGDQASTGVKSDAAGEIGDRGNNETDPTGQREVPSEELEAVSDDELPETLHSCVSAPVLANPPLIEGGEQVSSSEDEGPASPDSGYNVHHPEISLVNGSNHYTNREVSQSSDGLMVGSDLGSRGQDREREETTSQAASENVASLPPLEAEPISDEEDMGHTAASPIAFEGGEAGEIKDITSPVSATEEPSDFLDEVEPISADENSDTDGELPSGDEDVSKPESAGMKSSNNFESIESDEEGEMGAAIPNKQVSSSTNLDSSLTRLRSVQEKNDSEYMETISDEENLDLGDNISREASAAKSSQISKENKPFFGSGAVGRDSEVDRRPVAPNFNEHQVELDYEENEAEEGDGKPAEATVDARAKEDGEDGELAEGGGSDKDEGELSDDDCEEGEIKEPGSKKPFVMPKCRFFLKGHCTWGINCRFLHPGVNDKGNYQMIEIPGFKPAGVRARLGSQWAEQAEEPVELPPPPVADVPHVETAWERGLRIAKEQRKKASERKEQEPNFEDKRLNLSVDEERELNKENERMPKIIPKDPYYDQQAFEEDEYYKISRDPWQTGHYENFEVRYNRETSFSPPYRDKAVMPGPGYSRPYSPPVDKFGRDRMERREPFRPEPPPPTHGGYPAPSSIKRPDEWTDPWRRSKSPKHPKRKARSGSGGRRTRRSVSDSSHSSRSSSGSSSGSSGSSRSYSGSSGSSRSRSPEPAPPGVDRHDRYGHMSPSREQPRSAVSVRGSGGYNNYDSGYRRGGGRPYDPRSRGHGGGYGMRGDPRGGGSYYNNYGGGGGGYPERDMRDRGRDDRPGRMRARSPPDRPLPYVRPRPKSASSHSSSSRSRSRSRGRGSSRSRSRSSSASSRSSSSSSSSAGSADSEHLYRDLGSPSKNPRAPAAVKKKRTNSHKDRSSKGEQGSSRPGSQKHLPPPPLPPGGIDGVPFHDGKLPQNAPGQGRPEAKYASRNAPQAPVKAKDPLKVVGQKSNIKLTLLPKQQQSSLGSRPNPLDSPPHKRRMSERDTSPVSAPPAKRLNIPVPQASALRIATEKAAKLQLRQDKGKSPPPVSLSQPSSSMFSSSSSSNVSRTKATVSPQKQPSSMKTRPAEPAAAKPGPKPATAGPAAVAPQGGAASSGTKGKKSMSSRREELLKQLKAVEDAIARKKSKFQ